MESKPPADDTWDQGHSSVAGKLRRPSEVLRLRARELRDAGTSAEAALWAALRSRRLRGLKFRRQHPIGPFIADFYCEEARLVVELDGPVHGDQRERDRVRDTWMEQRGLRVLRIGNAGVFDSVDTVLARIADAASGPHPPAPSP